MHTLRSSRLAVLATGAAAALLLAACSSSGSGGSTGSKGSANSTSSLGSTASGTGATGKDIRADFQPPATLPVTTPVSKSIPSALKIVYLSGGASQSLMA